MATAKKLVTKKFHVEQAKDFVSTITSDNALYYVFASRHLSYEPNDTVINQSNDSIQSTTYDIYNNMLFGKRVTTADTVTLAPRYNWTGNTVYTMYDHRDGDLYGKQFFTVTQGDGDYYNVYKCLDNNSGTPSTEEPFGRDETPYRSEVDGYVWKYMYTIPGAQFTKFSTSSYIPVYTNTNIVATATSGSIDVIKVEDGGLYYNNYFVSEGETTAQVVLSEITSTVTFNNHGFINGQIVKFSAINGVDGVSINTVYYVSNAATNTFKLALTETGDPISFTVTGTGTGKIYFSRNAKFRANDITIGGNPLFYNIYETASSLQDYYQGCVIKITSGLSTGEYRIITNYSVQVTEEGIKKRIVLDTPFTTAPQPGDEYEIYPYVYVYGDGYETANCEARAIIDPDNGNTVSRIEILNPGANYRAATAAINLATATDAQRFDILTAIGNEREASLTPIIAPPGGHGSDPYHELGANRVGVSIRYINSENDNIPATNDYRTVGIIKNPLFNNVIIPIVEDQGTFLVGETIYHYKSIKIAGSADITNGSATITGSVPYLGQSLKIGDTVMVTDSTDTFISKIASIVNDSVVSFETPVNFTSLSADIYLLDVIGTSKITAVNVGSISVTNADIKKLNATDLSIVGTTSFAKATCTGIANITVNDKNVNGLFNTYVELNKLVGSLTSGEFVQDEQVLQDTTEPYYQATARLHSFNEGGDTDYLYLSNMDKVFNIGETLTTNTSGSEAEFAISNKYLGDLVKDSGQIVYIENVDPISREEVKTEVIKIILEF